MSEQLNNHEVLPKFEELELPAHATPEQPAASSPELSAEKARQDVAETATGEKPQANPLERLKAEEAAARPAAPQGVNRELQQITLQRTLQQIRRPLSAPQRAFSRLIHQPAVRVASEAAGRTVSRPSGLLGGGIVAFLGTSGYLYLARHTGAPYNYLVFLVLLGGGFIIGVFLEYLLRLTKLLGRPSKSK